MVLVKSLLAFVCLCGLTRLNALGQKLKAVKSQDEIVEEVARNKDKLIVLFFHTSGFAPFDEMERKLAKIEAHDNDVVFLNIDVTAHTNLMYEYNIVSNPTFIFLKNGEKVHSYEKMEEGAIIDLVNKYKEGTQNQKLKSKVPENENKPDSPPGNIIFLGEKLLIIAHTSQEQLDQITKKNSNKLIIIDFYAEWCNPCKIIAPVYKNLAAEFQSVVFLKVDGDDSGTHEAYKTEADGLDSGEFCSEAVTSAPRKFLCSKSQRGYPTQPYVEDLKTQFQVRSYPTFVLLKNGQKVDFFSGASENILRQKIAQHNNP